MTTVSGTRHVSKDKTFLKRAIRNKRTEEDNSWGRNMSSKPNSTVSPHYFHHREWVEFVPEEKMKDLGKIAAY